MFISPIIIQLAYRNVKSHWKQSLVAIISVVAGFTSFVLFEGYLSDIHRAYTDFNEHLEMFGDLIIENKGSSELEGRSDPWNYALSKEEQVTLHEFLKNPQNKVKYFSRFLNITGNLDSTNSSSIFQGIAYDVIEASELRENWRWDTYWGTPLYQSAKPNNQIIIGKRLAQKLDCLSEEIPNLENYVLDLQGTTKARSFLCEDEDFQISAMTEKGKINAGDFTISGILDKGFADLDSRYLVLSLPAAHKLFDTDKVNYYSVKLQSDQDLNQFTLQFNQQILNKYPQLLLIPWKKHLYGDLYRRTLSLLNVIRLFLISIIIFIGAMSVFNTLVKHVKERTREIGMFRSLGFRTVQIRQLFLLESVFLTWMGCILGGFISLILSLLINQIKFTYPSGQFSFESPFLILIQSSSYIYGFFTMTVVSLIACSIAIIKPSKENIAELLLHS